MLKARDHTPSDNVCFCGDHVTTNAQAGHAKGGTLMTAFGRGPHRSAAESSAATSGRCMRSLPSAFAAPAPKSGAHLPLAPTLPSLVREYAVYRLSGALPDIAQGDLSEKRSHFKSGR